MARKRKGRPLHGWLVLDKPPGMTSTQAMAKVRWLMQAEKAGHAGTLDPIATGILPIAFGEATKTVSYAMDCGKTYRFTLRFGESRTTDDLAGEVTATHDHRPSDEAIEAALENFQGEISQVPPQFSAIKVAGERAYDLAREGERVDLAPRIVRVDSFLLTGRPDADHAEFEVECGKGTYMRSLARDLALALGTVGHVSVLRRLRVGRFTMDQAISLDELERVAQTPTVEGLLQPIETALDDIPALALAEAEAHRLRHGQTVALLRRHDLERLDAIHDQLAGGEPIALAICGGKPVALVHVEGAEVRPVRVLNL
ncbi:tRNA pseudouridine(55) synthase TruB [Nitrospirillum sp. BR 11163]|uniref:tRNA pseudouridine(55) synthase TruB n=1 Tax=Nitrospirillum sp. BR 11163 TaxID=3104323 RepID=UPI002AFE0C35|nr:tRNA pseudouridine(55) synthase TruB [Nitrospirillum sp. BR 11163]MEA1677627.1 tRNA pseudouridine(55) synthase TruB [Nitrospirillum sp. BR 11163]